MRRRSVALVFVAAGVVVCALIGATHRQSMRSTGGRQEQGETSDDARESEVVGQVSGHRDVVAVAWPLAVEQMREEGANNGRAFDRRLFRVLSIDTDGRVAGADECNGLHRLLALTETGESALVSIDGKMALPPKLSEPVVVKGRVVDGHGEGVAEILVRAASESPAVEQALSMLAYPSIVARTERAGTFAILIPRAVLPVRVVLASGGRTRDEVRVVAGEETLRRDLIAERCGGIVVRVTDQAGTPMGDAPVSVIAECARDPSEALNRRTNGGGVCALDGLVPGVLYRVDVVGYGANPDAALFCPASGEILEQIVIGAPALTLHGTIADVAALPHDRLRAFARSIGLDRTARVREDGTFDFSALPAAAITLEVSVCVDEGAPLVKSVVRWSGADQSVALRVAGEAVIGRLIVEQHGQFRWRARLPCVARSLAGSWRSRFATDEDGWFCFVLPVGEELPVSIEGDYAGGFLAQIDEENRTPVIPSPGRSVTLRLPAANAEVASAIRYDLEPKIFGVTKLIRTSRGANWQNVPPTQVRVAAWAETCAPYSAVVDCQRETDAVVDVELRPQGTVELRLLSEDGSPRGGVRLRVRHDASWATGETVYESDPNGEIRMRRAPGARLDLEEPGWRVLSPSRVPVEAGDRLDIRVVEGGRIVVLARDRDGFALPNAALLVQQGGRQWRFTGDAEGRVRSDPLVPGVYDVVVRDDREEILRRQVRVASGEECVVSSGQ